MYSQEIINQNPISVSTTSSGAADVTKQNPKEVFYSPAGADLIVARRSIFDYSMRKVQERLNLRREQVENNQLEVDDNRYVNSVLNNCKELALNSSQLGDDRPLSCVRYAPSGMHVATGSLSCYIKLWDVVDLNCVDTLRGHQERITSLCWNSESQSLSQGNNRTNSA